MDKCEFTNIFDGGEVAVWLVKHLALTVSDDQLDQLGYALDDWKDMLLSADLS